MPSKRPKAKPRRQFLGNPVMLIRSCLALAEKPWHDLDEEVALELAASSFFRLKRGQVGLAVSTKGSKVLVLINGQMMPISRQNLRPCTEAA